MSRRLHRAFVLVIVLATVAAMVPAGSGAAPAEAIETIASRNERERIVTSPEDDVGYVAGELIVRFTPEVGRQIAVQSNTLDKLDAVGVSALDDLGARYGLQAVQPVFRQQVREQADAAQEHLLPTPSLGDVYRLVFPAEVDVEQLAVDYSANLNVVYAEPNYIAEIDTTPDDTYYAQQWGLTKINAPAAWDVQTGTLGIVIAIIDTGVDMDHPDLNGKIWNNPGETLDGVDNDGNGLIDDLHGYDWVNGDTDPQDDNGHGTHCAGISAAETDNAQGVAGVCWNCSVMPLKAFQSSGRGSYADIAAAINYAANKGAHVINMSFGSYADSQVVKDALENAYGTAVLVASAGNDNSLAKHYPAAYPWVIGVAATDGDDKKAGFSNYGTWVDVSAPGVNIYSTLFDDTYAGWSGTSMAAPFVSGLAALLVAEHPTWSKELIRGQLYQSTDNIDALNPLYVGKLGTGRINAGTALSLVPVPDIHYQSNAVGDGTGDGDGIVDAGESITLTVTLKNYWDSATNVTATLSTLDGWTTISDGTASFGGISAYASMNNQSNPFAFSADSNTPNNHDITFQLDVYADNGYHNTDSFYLTVQRGTEVSGILGSNATWTSDREYIVTGNILVPDGITLTIEAGTTVRFDPATAIQVDGNLFAVGSAGEPILFTSNSLAQSSGDWIGLLLNGTSSSQIELEYTITEYAGKFDGAYDPYGGGIRVLRDGNVSISNSIIRYNGFGGIGIGYYACGTPPTIQRNSILLNGTGNQYYSGGIFMRSGCASYSVDIDYNLIWGNNTDGVKLTDYTWATFDMHHNTLYGNEPYDVEILHTTQSISATLNYWGTDDGDQISSQIYDYYDSFTLGEVLYDPYYEAPSSSAPPILYELQIAVEDLGAIPLPGTPVGNEMMTVTLDFSAPMTTSVVPNLTFGVEDPYTQHRIENGQWISSTRWVGNYEVDVTTGDGINTFRIADARSADGFFAIPTDTRFQFTIQTAGTEAMLLQAAAGYGHVALSWPESDIPDLAGYNVYRSPVTNTNYTDTPLNDVLLTSRAYTDTEITNGTIYYYKYTVVDTGFGESGYSNEASATPNDPTSPTTPVVLDEGHCTCSTTALSGYWSAEDPESGIAEYEYGIGTTPGTVNVVNWTSVGTATQVTKSGLNLSDGVTYYINVKARNGVGTWSSVGSSDGILVSSGCPAADFSANPTSGYRPLDVQFTDQTTGSTLSRLWKFGDGATSTVTNPLHSYVTTGTFTVTLTVTGSVASNTRVKPAYITVDEPPPTAEFTANPAAGVRPLLVSFTDTSTGLVDSWSWSFGDGVTSTLQHPTHTYTSAGAYTVTLTVSGLGGADTEVKVDCIEVREEHDVFLPLVLRAHASGDVSIGQWSRPGRRIWKPE